MAKIARKGSGKIAGFLLPVIAVMSNNATEEIRSDKCFYPSALILVPTLDLATSIYNDALELCDGTVIRPVVLEGAATSFRDGVGILIATPRRLIEMLNQRIIKLKSIRFLVIDGVDEM